MAIMCAIVRFIVRAEIWLRTGISEMNVMLEGGGSTGMFDVYYAARNAVHTATLTRNLLDVHEESAAAGVAHERQFVGEEFN